MSRRHSRRRVAPRAGVPTDPLFRPPDRQPHRKALQLCAQVRDALTWVLGSATRDERLAECTVQAVEPLPGGNRMLVKVGIPPGVTASEVDERLAAAAPALRIDVAQAITRRKVPELVYLAVTAG
ncbi:MAG TPA: hypothetical protein VKE40_17635 [Gemmataceae bacterium]|nr:hypothetical protein [Gemmataceae bacterium]